MKYLIACLLLNGLAIPILAQKIIISGTIYNPAGKTLSYINIGIKGKENGTISDLNGRFVLTIPDSLQKDSLTFSSVGFQEKNVLIKSFQGIAESKIVLSEKVIELAEVIISDKEKKIRKIGIKGRTPYIVTPSASYNNADILEQARLIKINKLTKVLNANIYLSNKGKDSVNIRLNFYKLENELPGRRILERSIIKKFAMNKGWLTFDISQDDIYIDEDFVVSFEFLPDGTKKSTLLYFGAKIGATGSYLRRGSQGTWYKSPMSGASIYITGES